MRLIVVLISVVISVGAFIPGVTLAAQSQGSSQEAPTTLSRAALEKLVQPIALYPDILLQQILAASTFPDQILDAAMYNEQGKDPQGIKDQSWDDSVKGVANYPSVLVKLASDLDWTIALGSAFINQNEELRAAIQTMRARAKTVGNLEDSAQQHVIEEQGGNNTTIIRIEPTEPQVVYVPATTTAAVYEKPVETTSWLVPLASFGVGMALGYALGDDHDDHYYGGGFYGPGFWYGGPAVDNWVDYRRDRWDDAYDFARDREEWRQGNRDDWREYRQDLGRKQQEWRQERRANGTTMTPEKRAEARTRASTARASYQAKSPDERRSAVQSSNFGERARDSGFDREAANQRLNQARADGSLKQRAESAGFDRNASNQHINQARTQGDLKERAGSFDRSSIDRTSANERLQQARSNPDLQRRANDMRSNPQIQQRAQSASSAYAQRPQSGGYSAGAGLSGMSRSGSSVNRASARGMASRASAGGMARGGGGRRR